MDLNNLTISRFIPGHERRKFKDIIKFLAMVIDLAEGYKFENNYRTALSSVQMSHVLGLSVNITRNTFYGGLLHDIGEVGTPTSEEEKITQHTQELGSHNHFHPVSGSRIVSYIPTLEGVSKIIRWHHECWDGTGFPDKLKGEQIPIEASIVSFFDAYYTLKTTYKNEDLMAYINFMSGKKFNPEVVTTFVHLLKNDIIWTPENFADKDWLKTGVDAYELALLQDIKSDYVDTALNVIAQVIDTKHKYTHGHSRRVMVLAGLIAQKMNLEPIYRTLIEQGALLHDSGKVGISRGLLDKPSGLSNEEYNMIKKHPEISCALINNFTTLKDVAPLAKYHHERFDGKGYPESLDSFTIPLGARVIAVADTYDAITSDRAYRKALPDDFARAEIRKFSGKMFDPDVVNAFLEIPEHEIKLAFDLAANNPLSSKFGSSI
ncbi:MAG: HD domain-containing phosphohydrolase [Candidatus Sericytochromatia bacterium]